MPSERLRKLEIEANAAFDQYRDMYVMFTTINSMGSFKCDIMLFFWKLDNRPRNANNVGPVHTPS